MTQDRPAQLPEPDATRPLPAATPSPGPVIGSGLRASDADRDQVIQVLSTAFAEGRLTSDEHDDRVSQAMASKTFDQLVPLTADLVLVSPATGQNTPVASTGSSNEPATSHRWEIVPGADETDQMIAIFGGVTRKGRWRMKRRTTSLALFGGVDLDLNEATFEAPVVEISGAWIFGGLDIKVPEGIEVRDQTAGIFGGTDISRVGAPQPGAPVLVLKGFTLFGGVSVSGPKPKKRRRW